MPVVIRADGTPRFTAFLRRCALAGAAEPSGLRRAPGAVHAPGPRGDAQSPHPADRLRPPRGDDPRDGRGRRAGDPLPAQPVVRQHGVRPPGRPRPLPDRRALRRAVRLPGRSRFASSPTSASGSAPACRWRCAWPSSRAGRRRSGHRPLRRARVLHGRRAGGAAVRAQRRRVGGGAAVAIAFWTWLWGPIGLILATPLTVCIVVVAKYVPELEFLWVLMGDEPAVSTDIALYQRLLAEDQDEAMRHRRARAGRAAARARPRRRSCCGCSRMAGRDHAHGRIDGDEYALRRASGCASYGRGAGAAAGRGRRPTTRRACLRRPGPERGRRRGLADAARRAAARRGWAWI